MENRQRVNGQDDCQSETQNPWTSTRLKLERVLSRSECPGENRMRFPFRVPLKETRIGRGEEEISSCDGTPSIPVNLISFEETPEPTFSDPNLQRRRGSAPSTSDGEKLRKTISELKQVLLRSTVDNDTVPSDIWQSSSSNGNGSDPIRRNEIHTQRKALHNIRRQDTRSEPNAILRVATISAPTERRIPGLSGVFARPVEQRNNNLDSDRSSIDRPSEATPSQNASSQNQNTRLPDESSISERVVSAQENHRLPPRRNFFIPEDCSDEGRISWFPSTRPLEQRSTSPYSNGSSRQLEATAPQNVSVSIQNQNTRLSDENLKISERVVWITERRQESGTVMWLGDIIGIPTAGINFDNAVGNTDGIYKGTRYFKCATRHGGFVPISALIKYNDYYFPRTPILNSRATADSLVPITIENQNESFLPESSSSIEFCNEGASESEKQWTISDEEDHVIICAICQDPLLMTTNSGENIPSCHPDAGMISTYCGHLFHASCLNKWFHTKPTQSMQECPYCKKMMDIKSTIRIFPVLGKP